MEDFCRSMGASSCCLNAREFVIRMIWMAAQIILGERAAGKRVRVKTCEQRERSKEGCGEKWTVLLTDLKSQLFATNCPLLQVIYVLQSAVGTDL